MVRNGDPARLARRLRQLRQARSLTQQDLARVFGVGMTSVSSWESTRAPKPPTQRRLLDYATFFSSSRFTEHEPRLPTSNELTEEERTSRDELFTELEQLRGTAAGDEATVARPHDFWHFPDGGPVRLICRALTDPTPYAKASNHNYMQLAGYTDIDALVELFGHIRARNPDSDVQFELSNRIESDDLGAHLVLLGSWAARGSEGARLAGLIGLPVRQVEDLAKVPDGEVFELVEKPERRFGPVFVDNNPDGVVAEDVGFVYRTPNPSNFARTVTFCSGVFSRGVYGAVRCFTDRKLRDENEKILADLFGEKSSFGLLMRVPVFDHATMTPDLRNPMSILDSWPEKTKK